MRNFICGSAALALALVVLAGSGPAEADIAIPGTHSRSTEARIDFGPYADYVTRVHTIAAGDTFGGIAKQMLGKLGRWKEIADLNPGMDADALPVGKTLLVPPRKTPLALEAKAKAGGPQHWWDILAVIAPADMLQHATSGVDVPYGPYGCWLLAVRHDKLAGLIAAAKEHKRGMRGHVDDLLEGGANWLARTTEGVAGRGNVRDADPVWKIRVESRLTSIAGGTIHLKQTSKRYYDRDGKELTKEQIAARKTGANVVLILLAVLGAAGLFFVVRRRQATTQGTPATT